MFCRQQHRSLLLALYALLAGFCAAAPAIAQGTHVVQTNARVRVLAANLSSGNYQRYEAPGLAILKGLKPDIVAIQEFNYASATGRGTNTPAALREMIDQTFGADFSYFREIGSGETYSIPNGIISRYPIVESGSWDDPQIPDRGFAWAGLRLPGTNVLYVVSVHLKANSSSSATRATEAARLKSLIQSFLPADSLLVLAGDLNIGSPSEPALATFKTFLLDSPVPTDAASGGDPDTNLGRTERYDYLLPSPELARLQTNVVIGGRSFPGGLVFDSRVYSPLSDVPPVSFADSGAAGMQHMAVTKDFIIAYTITNPAPPRPMISLGSGLALEWIGFSNFNYVVQATHRLDNPLWTNTATLSSPSGALSFPITNRSANPQIYYRVVVP